jgi:hypothetical protein
MYHNTERHFAGCHSANVVMLSALGPDTVMIVIYTTVDELPSLFFYRVDQMSFGSMVFDQ